MHYLELKNKLLFFSSKLYKEKNFRSPIDTNDIKDPYGVDPKCFEGVSEHMLNHTESINIKEKIIKTIKDGGENTRVLE